ncbi:MAG: energy transducer TonB [Deltaproteobacteria bacterium]|nr:energy transducer TonB [Deltaproteobacteria bacterium]
MSSSVEARAGRFGWYDGDDSRGTSWLSASLSSLAIYGGIIAAVVLVGSATRQVIAPEKKVDVTFVEKVAKPPPPPPPAPVAAAKPVEVKPPAASAPVVRPDQKIRKLDKPPPVKALAAPKEMPQEAPREADPSEDKGIAVYGEPGAGDPAGLEGGVSQGGVAGGSVGGAIALPEDATAPVALASNEVPAYPQEARASGTTGTVTLKLVILADGSVADVEVMRGEEPFVSAAVATVKKWKYEPARHQGQPITVYRVVKIPFKLTV